MTAEQFRYFVKIVRQQIAQDNAKLTQSVRSGQFSDVSYHAGKSDALREVLFLLHGMASDDTEDAFK